MVWGGSINVFVSTENMFLRSIIKNVLKTEEQGRGQNKSIRERRGRVVDRTGNGETAKSQYLCPA